MSVKEEVNQICLQNQVYLIALLLFTNGPHSSVYHLELPKNIRIQLKQLVITDICSKACIFLNGGIRL
jgi:hypothetical protein